MPPLGYPETMIEGKTIVITGAANGIGRAWAEMFKADGAEVIACDKDQNKLQELDKLGVTTVLADVSKPKEVESFIDLAINETGKIDALFNNAGMGFGYKLEDFPDGGFEHHVAVHLFGAVYGMRYAIPYMREQGCGRIINTISRNAETDVPTTSAYAAAKAGIWSASRVASKEVADTDILINMLIPGPTNTQIWGKEMSHLQDPEETYPTAKMLALLEKGGPSGKVFWDEKEYLMFGQENEILKGK
ncbi:MAG: SDR family oxidoreductase [Gammaproteobacteria bacterium]|nr:MAG: SDR family oxidoreductase [Gammaproteobacteria bacterium]